MTRLAELNRAECFGWLEKNSPAIESARDDFVKAVRAYGEVLANSKGAFEWPGATAASFVDSVMDRADAALADEVQRDLNL